ncbi:glycoside hydrolase family 44 protein [Patescibacteria group bacterium]|nr:glycoside hydrolase family 44 protein [Patescibacteria group bacterium]
MPKEIKDENTDNMDMDSSDNNQKETKSDLETEVAVKNHSKVITLAVVAAIVIVLAVLFYFILWPVLFSQEDAQVKYKKPPLNEDASQLPLKPKPPLDDGYLSPFGALGAEVMYSAMRETGIPPSFVEGAQMGLKWNRGSLGSFEGLKDIDYDFEKTDKVLLSSISAGIPNYVYNIFTNNRGYEQWSPPDKLVDDYIEWVKYGVERYDGDGYNDMPGLIYPVKYWQIDNEPDLEADTVGDGYSYAHLLKITYQAIKEADPEAKVLSGGIGIDNSFINISQRSAKFFEDIMDTYKPERYFDIFDLHYYGNARGDYRIYEDRVKIIRNLLDSRGWQDVPIWTTEMGSYSGQPKDWDYQSEVQQAGDYVKRWVHGISVKVPVIFGAWWLREGFSIIPGDDYFDHTGLIFDGEDGDGNTDPYDRGMNVKKIGYYSFQVMAEKLEGLRYQEMKVLKDNVYAYRFLNLSTNKSTYVVWWDGYKEGTSITSTLSGINGDRVKITDAITDFSGNREVTYGELNNGQISLNLKAYHPLFIEEQ